MITVPARPHAVPTLDLLRGNSMGTRWSVQIPSSARDLHPLHHAIQQALDLVVAQMSTWEPESDISRFNRSARGWIVLPAEFFQVLQCALQIAEASSGAFDPSVGALVGLWGFGAHAHPHAPQRDTLDQARAGSGWRSLRLDAQSRSVLQPGGLQLDLSAIAKGFGADLVAARLAAHGISSALVEVGGELVAIGNKPDASCWRVLAESDPERDDSAPTVLQLANCAVATSGDRWHRRQHGGREYAHTLDPRNAQPLADAPLAVTVIASNAMLADGWATAMSVLGVHAGLALADAQQLAVRFVQRIDDTVVVRCNSAFERYIAP